MLDGGEHLDEAIKKQLQPLTLGCRWPQGAGRESCQIDFGFGLRVGASPFQQRLYLRGEEAGRERLQWFAFHYFGCSYGRFLMLYEPRRTCRRRRPIECCEKSHVIRLSCDSTCQELQVVVLPLRYDAVADLRLQSAAGLA